MLKKFARLLNNSVQFYRVKDWFYLLPIIFLGMLFENIYFYKETNKVILSLLLIITYFGFGYALNDIADKKLFHKKAWIFLSIPFIFLYTEASLFFPALIFFFLVIHILNLLYSYPPLYLKKQWGFSVLINALTFGSPFVFGAYIQRGKFSLETIKMGMVLAYVFVPLQLIHEWSHLEEDNKKRTIEINKRYYYSILFSFIFLIVISLIVDIHFKMKGVFFVNSTLFSLMGIRIIMKENYQFILADKIKEIRKKLRFGGIFYGFGWIVSFIFKNVSG
jgi:4-hydroxybenzoate polyprenyltransferase